jgi:hypothetical protein
MALRPDFFRHSSPSFAWYCGPKPRFRLWLKVAHYVPIELARAA